MPSDISFTFLFDGWVFVESGVLAPVGTWSLYIVM
jgi:hypothetical protein